MESGWHRQSNIDGEIKALPTSESILIQIFFGGGGDSPQQAHLTF